jgi:hypothetical protein
VSGRLDMCSGADRGRGDREHACVPMPAHLGPVSIRPAASQAHESQLLFPQAMNA